MNFEPQKHKNKSKTYFTFSHNTAHTIKENKSRYLFPGSTKHGFLDIRVHPSQGIVTTWDALQVAQSPVLVSHHFLHHSWVPGKLHSLRGKIWKSEEVCLFSFILNQLSSKKKTEKQKKELHLVRICFTCRMSSGLLSM